METIKFRAWNKKTKKMYKVLHLHQADYENQMSWATVEGFDIIEQKEIHIQIQPKDIELMQFTGLKDKNGKEIYEGDIVKYEHHYAGTKNVEVKYDKEKTGFYPLHCFHKSFEVIGNIYENPTC